VPSRLLKTTVLAAAAAAIWTQMPQVTLRRKVRRRLSLKCWFIRHEDWIRRTPDRLYLECFECGVALACLPCFFSRSAGAQYSHLRRREPRRPSRTRPAVELFAYPVPAFARGMVVMFTGSVTCPVSCRKRIAVPLPTDCIAAPEFQVDKTVVDGPARASVSD
jgi:hypothetical protein